MKERLVNLWEEVHSSFWFVPTSMALAAVLLSVLTIDIDRRMNASYASSVGVIWSGGASGARSLLSTIAGSMITVAGVVFSITIVSLTLASSQFGPRLLRNFIQDTGNQITLGTFVSTFLYCILVLRTVRAQDEGGFIPFISITCGVALAILSLGVLIFFIHHVSSSIQAERLVARVGMELSAAIEKHFPEGHEDGVQAGAEESFHSQVAGLPATAILSRKSGYLQSVNREELLHLAKKMDARMVLKSTPGDFILYGESLVQLRGGKEPSEAETEQIRKRFKLGDQRTELQDVRYGARQLSEIASRALSPGINDPYTAMGCIDWMGSALERVVTRQPAVKVRADEENFLRLWEVPPTFASLCEATLEPLIAYGLDSALVGQNLIDMLARVMRAVRREADAEVLRGYAGRVRTQAKVMLKDEDSLRRLNATAESIMEWRIAGIRDD